jgi:hypothetical protein
MTYFIGSASTFFYSGIENSSLINVGVEGTLMHAERNSNEVGSRVA